MITVISPKQFTEKTQSEDRFVMLYFWSPDCIVCGRVEKFLKEIEKHYTEKMIVVAINVQDGLNISQQFSVRSLPTFVFLKKSVVKFRINGFRGENNMEKEIRNLIF